jgi:hypothetical protein
MTSAERQQRSRARLRDDGGHLWTVRVQARRWAYLSKAAAVRGDTTGQLLAQLLGSVVDRFIEVTERSTEMMERGATAAEAAEFHRAHLFPALPPRESETEARR